MRVQAGGRFLRVAIALAALSAGPARAAELRSGETLTIPRGETVDDDLYGAVSTLEVLGDVDGDLVVAGGTITVQGSVSGDVLAVGGTLVLLGDVAGSVRSIGGTVTVQGPVERDVAAVGGTVNVSSQVKGDVLVVGGAVTLSGETGGDVYVQAGQLILADTAVVNGDVRYSSGEAARIAPGAQVAGVVDHRATEGAFSPGPAFFVVMWLRTLIGLLAFGLLCLLVAPAFLHRSEEVLRERPGRSLGVGALMALFGPFAATLVMILGAIIGGWWVGVAALVLLMLAMVIGLTVGALRVGHGILQRFHGERLRASWALVAGLVAVAIVGIIPVLGALLILLLSVAGLGALATAAFDARRRRPWAGAPPPIEREERVYATGPRAPTPA